MFTFDYWYHSQFLSCFIFYHISYHYCFNFLCCFAFPVNLSEEERRPGDGKAMKRNRPRFLQAHRQADSGYADSTGATPTLNKTNPECNHHQSEMEISKPSTFLKFPYRPSVMTLLRRIRTTGADSVGSRADTHALTVYASFQQHWDPNLIFPVLTLVAACDTKIYNFLYERHLFNEMKLTCAVTNGTTQHRLTFDIPLPTIKNSSSVITMEVVRAYEHSDAFQKFVVHIGDARYPLLAINVHNLTIQSCNRLHVLSILTPEDPEKCQEKYILGLSGCRLRNFRTVYIHKTNQPMHMLDAVDLVSIGYCKEDRSRSAKKIPVAVLEIQIRDLLTMPESLFPRLWPTNHPWGYSLSPNLRAPERYPQPQRKVSTLKYAKNSPMLFPPGFFKYRICAYPTRATVLDVMNDFHEIFGPFTVQDVHDTASRFAYYHFVARKTDVLENLDTLWSVFLQSCAIQTQNTHVKISPLYRRDYMLNSWLPWEIHPTWNNPTPTRISTPASTSSSTEDLANLRSLIKTGQPKDDDPPPYIPPPSRSRSISPHLNDLNITTKCGPDCQCEAASEAWRQFTIQYNQLRK